MRSPLLLALAVLLPGMSVLAQQPPQQPVPIGPVQRTQPTRGTGTAIQGAAVWIHPTVPASSLLLVADNQSGLLAYNLDGTERGLLVPGVLTGVDVREGFPAAGGGTQSLVMLANASVGLLGYVIDPATFSARPAGIEDFSTGFSPTAVALYRSPSTQRFYAFAASAGGAVVQYEIGTSADAGTSTVPVRSLSVGGPVVGLAADDALGVLYVVQQDSAIWRYGAEPNATDSRVAVDTTSATQGGRLVRPLGNVALYTASNNRGYLLAVSGGENVVRVYDRSLSAPTYQGGFNVAADGGIDAVENSRLVVVTNRALGPLFTQGMVAVHDGSNLGGNENFKLIKWPAVAEGLSPPLIVDNAPPPSPSDGGTPDAGADAGTGPTPLPPPSGGGIGVDPTPDSCGCAAASLPGSVLLGLAGVLLLSRRRPRA